jgi:cobalamin biosynthesis Mg chelatase CobN
MRELFEEFLKSKNKSPERVPDEEQSLKPIKEKKTMRRKSVSPERTVRRRSGTSEGKQSSSRQSSSGRRGRSSRSSSGQRRRSSESSSRPRERSSSPRAMPKYLYMIDVPEDILNALRVSYFCFFFIIWYTNSRILLCLFNSGKYFGSSDGFRSINN